MLRIEWNQQNSVKNMSNNKIAMCKSIIIVVITILYLTLKLLYYKRFNFRIHCSHHHAATLKRMLKKKNERLKIV